ncbi:MAG: FliA/WhiG family RNA polymerase sigma factor [Deltaproteobacteria bacterium]|nr:FliA/WhiG family RNA polymerase sigma factor [Deltaproteobacteria bacterium]
MGVSVRNQWNKKKLKYLNSRQRSELIQEYMPLIKFIAKKIAMRLPANIELDDLVSSGVIGLIDAIEKYDPTRDNQFKTYAEFRIRGAILDELRAQDWVPRSVREKSKMLERACFAIEKRLGRRASNKEIAKELGVSLEELHDLLSQTKPVSILNIDSFSDFSQSDKKNFLKLIQMDSFDDPLSSLNDKDIKEMIISNLEELPEKQRLVLALYYYEDLNLKEIGEILNVTESRVSQLHTQAMGILKKRFKNQLNPA